MSFHKQVLHQSKVFNENNNFLKPKLVTVWLGATDTAQEGTFVWMTSKRQVTDGFSNWAAKQPDNSKGNEVIRRVKGLHINRKRSDHAVLSSSRLSIRVKQQ